MSGYIVRRLLLAALTVLGVSFLVFAAVRWLPGNRVDVLLSTGTNTGPGAKAKIEHELGFDRPFLEQYGRWLGDVATGHLGKSLVNGQSLAFYIKEGLPVSIELGLISLLFGIVFGVSIGIASAVWQDTWIDYVLRSFAIFLLAIPGFLIAVVVIVLASRFWNWNPPITYIPLTRDPLHNFGQFLLPGAILGFSSAAALMRFTRTAMLDVLRQDYIRTARSKGLQERGVAQQFPEYAFPYGVDVLLDEESERSRQIDAFLREVRQVQDKYAMHIEGGSTGLFLAFGNDGTQTHAHLYIHVAEDGTWSVDV